MLLVADQKAKLWLFTSARTLVNPSWYRCWSQKRKRCDDKHRPQTGLPRTYRALGVGEGGHEAKSVTLSDAGDDFSSRSGFGFIMVFLARRFGSTRHLRTKSTLSMGTRIRRRSSVSGRIRIRQPRRWRRRTFFPMRVTSTRPPEAPVMEKGLAESSKYV